MRFPIHIRDQGLDLVLDYEAFLDYHAGHALAGAAVGWRAMEQASVLLSDEVLWERGRLTVGARHAGPGVRDALEYVTRCFTRGRFRPEAAQGGAGPCGSAADFYFTVSDGCRVAELELRPGVIPPSFFAAVARCREHPDDALARMTLSERKAEAAACVAAARLSDMFRCEVTRLMRLPPGDARA